MIFVAVFLDNIDQSLAKEFRKNKGNESFCSTFLATFKLLRDPRLLLLIPLTMYSGFEQSFLSGEYTKVPNQIQTGAESKNKEGLGNKMPPELIKIPPKCKIRGKKNWDLFLIFITYKTVNQMDALHRTSVIPLYLKH